MTPRSDEGPSGITRLVGVYNADGGLMGELRYLVDHYLRGRSCSLCDVTHSPIRRKAAWDTQAAALGIPFELRHLNELDPPLADFVAGRAACIVAESGAGLTLLLDNDAISSTHGDVDEFFRLLRTAVSS